MIMIKKNKKKNKTKKKKNNKKKKTKMKKKTLMHLTMKSQKKSLMQTVTEAEPVLSDQGQFQMVLDEFLLLSCNQEHSAESCQDHQCA